MANIKKILFLLTLLFYLSGRVYAVPTPDAHIVTRVDVLYACENSLLLRQYTRQPSMQAVLNYLRLAKYAGMPESNPLREKGDTCRITVYLSTGRTHVYLLHAGQFLCRDDEPWELAEWQDPLLPLLHSLPSDG